MQPFTIFLPSETDRGPQFAQHDPELALRLNLLPQADHHLYDQEDAAWVARGIADRFGGSLDILVAVDFKNSADEKTATLIGMPSGITKTMSVPHPRNYDF